MAALAGHLNENLHYSKLVELEESRVNKLGLRPISGNHH